MLIKNVKVFTKDKKLKTEQLPYQVTKSRQFTQKQTCRIQTWRKPLMETVLMQFPV